MGEAIVENTVSSEKEKRITIDICKKLLATNIVAKVFLGLDNNWFTKVALEAFFCDKSSKCFGDKEKRATSDAATIAVQKSKTSMPNIPKNKLVSGLERRLKLGSGSKFTKIS